jgi:hypothetical protein
VAKLKRSLKLPRPAHHLLVWQRLYPPPLVALDWLVLPWLVAWDRQVLVGVFLTLPTPPLCLSV